MNFLTRLYVTLRSVRRHPLNVRRPNRAMLDFCLAQVVSRAVPGDVCVGYPNGSLLLVPPHMKGAAHFIHPRLNEFAEMSFVMHALRKDDLFVDAGANIGAYSVLAGAAAGARVVAFEPSPFTFQFLDRNMRLNGLSVRASARRKALGRQAGVLRFTDGLGTENAVAAESQPGQTVEVPVARLDDELAGEHPFLMKMDVEGFETEACAGAERILADTALQAFIIERNNSGRRYGFDEEALHGRIRSQGFRPFEYFPLARELKPLPVVNGNFIYVRDVAAMEKRLREAAPYEIDGVRV